MVMGWGWWVEGDGVRLINSGSFAKEAYTIRASFKGSCKIVLSFKRDLWIWKETYKIDLNANNAANSHAGRVGVTPQYLLFNLSFYCSRRYFVYIFMYVYKHVYWSICCFWKTVDYSCITFPPRKWLFFLNNVVHSHVVFGGGTRGICCLAFFFWLRERERARERPPAPTNRVKIFKGWPPEMPLRNWYNCGTNHFHLTSVVRCKWKNQLYWVIKPVPHDLVRRIRFWRIKISGTWF